MAITGWSTANYLTRAAAVATQPILVSAWGLHKATGTQGRAFEVGISGNNQHRRTLQVDAAALPGAVQHSTSSVTGIAVATAAPAVDTWFQMSGWFLTNTSREITWDNANLGSNTVSKAPSAPDTTRIGLGCGGVGDWATAGALAEVSVWDATGFTATDRRNLDAKLAAGDNPLAINAEAAQPWTGKLLAYWPMLSHTDLADASGNGHDMTMVGTLTTFASHPPVDAAPGGGGAIHNASVAFSAAAQASFNAQLILASSVAESGAAQFSAAASMVLGASVGFNTAAQFSANGTVITPAATHNASVAFSTAAQFAANGIVIPAGAIHLASVAFSAALQFAANGTVTQPPIEVPPGSSTGGGALIGVIPKRERAGQILYARAAFAVRAEFAVETTQVIHMAAIAFTLRPRLWVDSPVTINDDADLLDIITLLAAA
jgi:hypothetical protein